MFLRDVKDRVDVEPVVAEVGLFDFECGFALLVELDFVDDVEVAAGVAQEELEVVDFAVVDVECGGVDGDLQFFEGELADGLVADVPWVHEKLAALVLSEYHGTYFQILRVLSVLQLKMVSVFFEYVRHRMVPEWPVKVWTMSLDLGSMSQTLMVRSAEPVITKIWLNIFSLRMHLTSPLCMPA